MSKKIAILLCVFILVVGCTKEFSQDFKNLFPLRDAIIKEFGIINVGVTIQNGNCIGVSFVNSKFNRQPESVQDDIRQRTLDLISSNYPDDDKINRAFVAFVIHRRHFFLFNYTDSRNTKFYEKSPDGSWTGL